ncbi:uncharacterized protein LOC110437131 [Sorghum bicolor]|uniref:uncharacterized protein LOC110437131 n=1 Tax=Sorghum bicolor TaxID=4558 RepID=UPI000B425B1C|nr:uncharacterized protein LOC110437131 [Sorghum bicolor]|eukprot:XP_021321099.1 uncharacterized protein LOC110437131 [Sorghum bicolor]
MASPCRRRQAPLRPPRPCPYLCVKLHHHAGVSRGAVLAAQQPRPATSSPLPSPRRASTTAGRVDATARPSLCLATVGVAAATTPSASAPLRVHDGVDREPPCCHGAYLVEPTRRRQSHRCRAPGTRASPFAEHPMRPVAAATPGRRHGHRVSAGRGDRDPDHDAVLILPR